LTTLTEEEPHLRSLHCMHSEGSASQPGNKRAWEQVHGVRVVRLCKTAVRLTHGVTQLHPMVACLKSQQSSVDSIFRNMRINLQVAGDARCCNEQRKWSCMALRSNSSILRCEMTMNSEQLKI